MTQRVAAWTIAWLFVVAGVAPALAGDGQRARSRGDAAAGEDAAVATTGARARSDDRRADHAGDAGASAKERTSARERASGPVVVTPVVVAPTQAGGFTVGKPIVVGNAFAVGHGLREPAEPRGGGRGYDRHSFDDHSPSIVTVPVYVPVYVESETVTQTVTAPARVAAAPQAEPTHDPGSHVPFSPWYTIVDGLMAGVPVPLPSPDTFTETNISASLTELRETGDVASRVATREYAKATGGLSFDIEPADAAVFVDGRFVGSVDDFAPDREPLLLRFGGYTVELRAEGYGTVRFPVSVSMGEVMPFKGTLPKIER